MSNEPEKSFEQEWGTFLNEVRIALPGAQLSGASRLLYFSCFLTTATFTAFLIAPTVYHRLHWRRDVQDKEEMFRTCNRLTLIGGVLLAIAMSSALFMTSYFFIDRTLAWVALAVALVSFGWLWFALPLSRRRKERNVRV